MKSPMIPIAMLGFAAAIGWHTDAVKAETNPVVRQSALNAHDEAASASLIGQFRTSITAWLWVHTDLYLHNGVQMRPITDAELKAGVSVQHSAKDGHEQLHKDAAVTLIPSPERDFRGIFGDVERATGAWKDMRNHSHNDPIQSLPLYRLMTWLDPQFIEGWTTGAMVMARDRSEAGTRKAISFLQEGLKENSNSVDLLSTLGYAYLTRRKDLPTAVRYFNQAVGAGLSRFKAMGDGEREAFENTFRWLALCYRDLGRPEDVARICKLGIELYPEDKILPRLLRNAATGASAAADAEGMHSDEE